MRMKCWLSAVAMVVVLAAASVGRAADVSGAKDEEDIKKAGVYQSGQWEYRLAVTGEGTKSRGTRGELFFDAKPVPDPGVKRDYYLTPWGAIQWVGDDVLPWGAHGWMAKDSKAGGRELAAPYLEAGGPVVMAMVLAEGEAAKDQVVEPWVAEAMGKMGVTTFKLERPWFVLGDQAVTIHDTKMYGTLLARMAPARDSKTLSVILDGSEAHTLALDRKDGAVKVISYKLGKVLGEINYYLAFKVLKAATAWPKPLDVGMESDGKEVVVKGPREVVIGLPGDKNSGCVWVVKAVQGDSPKGSSVKAAGSPQFTPGASARVGVYENTFRVLGVGKTFVDLEYKRTWQTDKPAEKTYKVTLDVQETVDKR